jgi:hypothetical protein
LRFSAYGERGGGLVHGTLPYAFVLFSFPLIYYITSPEVYYRRPMDPLFVILAVEWPVASGGAGQQQRSNPRLSTKKGGHTGHPFFEFKGH